MAGTIELDFEQTGSMALGIDLAFVRIGNLLEAVVCNIQPGSVAA